MLPQLLALLPLLPLVYSHGFISQAKSDLVGFTKAQKASGNTAWREVSSNTGWIGSNFISQKGIACGASDTPNGKVAAPGGSFFSDASQTASQHLPVKAGGTFTLVVSGNPGEGFPHPNGHIQTYLADCGDTCVGKDVSTLDFFKIQSEKDGIQNTLRAGGVNADLDGQVFSIDMPAGLASSKYILRYELIAFGQSSSAEGNQDQYYPFCAQIDLQDGSGALDASSFSTVKFPGAYENGNIDQSTVPGPAVISLASSGSGSSASSSGSSSSGSSSSASSSSGSVSTNSTNPTGAQSSSTNTTDSQDASGDTQSTDDTDECTSDDGTSPITLTNISDCANTCLSVKFTEASRLAPSCDLSSADKDCFCSANNFVGAFAQCLKDNCSSSDASTAVSALDSTCGTSATKRLAKKFKRSLVQQHKRHTSTKRTIAAHSKRAHANSHRVKRSKVVDSSIFEDFVVRRYARSGSSA